MKNYLKTLSISLLTIPVLVIIGLIQAQAASLEVMNPRGAIPPPPFHAPTARVSNLDGKKVGIYWIGKAGGDNFWNGVEELLNQRYPKVQTVRYEGPFDLGDARAAELAREVDTMFYGVGD